MVKEILSILGTLLVALPILIPPFYFNKEFKIKFIGSLIGNPLEEQRGRKKIKLTLNIFRFIQAVGLGCLVYSIIIS